MGILRVFSTWKYSVLEVLIFEKVSGRSYFKNSGKNRFLELCSCCSRDVLCPCLCTTKELEQGLVFLICLLGKNTDLQSFLLYEQNTADRLRRHFLSNHERELKDALISSVSERCYQSVMDKKKMRIGNILHFDPGKKKKRHLRSIPALFSQWVL